MTTSSTAASSPSRSAMLASTSAVQHRTGASRLTVASPVREADVLRPELAAQRHPLLVDQRLDRAGVDRPPPVGERGEVEGGGDERLPRAGGGVQDDVPALEELEDRLLLGRVEGEALVGDVVEEAPEQRRRGPLRPRGAGGRRGGRPSPGYCGPGRRLFLREWPRLRHGPFRALFRAARRSLYRLRARGVPVVYDTRYQRGVFGVPMDPLRGEKVLGALEEAGLLVRDLVSEPRPASLQNLLRVHTPEYLHAVQEADALTRILGVEVPAREAEATLDLQRLMTGGTIQATRLALRTGGVAVHLGGGFHHAMPDAGARASASSTTSRSRSGACAGAASRSPCSWSTSTCTTATGRGASSPTTRPSTPSRSTTTTGETPRPSPPPRSRSAPAWTTPASSATLREALPPVFEAVKPGLVVYLAGTDPAEDDPIGNWRLSREGALRARPLRDVARAARRAPRPDGGRPRRRLRPPRLALQRALRALARLGARARARRGGGARPRGASAGWGATCATRRRSTTGCPSR